MDGPIRGTTPRDGAELDPVVTRGGGHRETEDFPWTIVVVDHPPRKDSAGYRASRRLMVRLAAGAEDWAFAPGPYQDHHGGGVWLRDDAGWMCVTTGVGIEWSAQFCADPHKVDRLRRQVARLVAGFPSTLPGYLEQGYDRAETLLATPITSAEHVAAWTDSIFNASVPLPASAHTGTLPHGAGYHHYPKPIVDIDHVRYDDFQLFVTDRQGNAAVVVPIAPRGSGDGRVRLLAAHQGSAYAARLASGDDHAGLVIDLDGKAGAPAASTSDVLDATDPLARQAYAKQR